MGIFTFCSKFRTYRETGRCKTVKTDPDKADVETTYCDKRKHQCDKAYFGAARRQFSSKNCNSQHVCSSKM